jgi:hypothetical protein
MKAYFSFFNKIPENMSFMFKILAEKLDYGPFLNWEPSAAAQSPCGAV